MELARTISEMKSTMNSLKDEQKLIESAFEEKQNELRMMQERRSNLGQRGSQRISSRVPEEKGSRYRGKH
jgi:Sec-independent protein translocase protein TatA